MSAASNTPSIPKLLWWPAYDCATQGHIRDGFSTGTNPDHILWANYCKRCGAKL